MTKVLIIAEAGVNHNGELEKAFQLIDIAADAGADVVKFQTFKAEKLVSVSAEKAEYQKRNLGNANDSQFEMLKKLELSDDWHYKLKSYAVKKGIIFASTGFDEASVSFLDEMGQTFFKIPSGEITNKPLIEFIAKKGKDVILSTGMSTLLEIKDAVNILIKNGLNQNQITVLHCNTEYPTPMKDVNLLAMLNIKENLHVDIGYSDHTLGIEVAIAAVALGATVIEKHFTISRDLPGPDHAASLEPKELKAMVRAIRNIEIAISGSGQKEPSESEIKNVLIARKSIHCNKSLVKGHILTEEDLIAMRPGNGISVMEWNKVIGKRLINDKNKFDKLLLNDLE